jgi:ribosomal protein S18 acetylase RimI-like enzyme
MKWDLAIQQRVEHVMRATEADWLRDGFGAQARFKAFVAEYDDRVIGMVTCTENYYTSLAGTTLQVHDLFVEPAYRGCGVASVLLTRVAAHSVEKGIPQIELTTRQDNTARTLYRRLGFKRVRHAFSYVVAGPALAQLASTVAAPISAPPVPRRSDPDRHSR